MARTFRDEDYEDVRNPDLPWGHWYLYDEDEGGFYADEDGCRWSSLRNALWCDGLGMPGDLAVHATHTALEFLLHLLLALDRRVLKHEEIVNDFFNGAWHCQEHYGYWLYTVGLIERASGMFDPYASSLTAKGLAVLKLLANIRHASDAPVPLGMRWNNVFGGLVEEADLDQIKTLLNKQEAFADNLDYRFVRCEIDRRPSVALIGERLGPNIPHRRKLWSFEFPDIHARERFYLWLHERLDRWEVWGELAYERGGRAFSEHLLTLALCDERIIAE